MDGLIAIPASDPRISYSDYQNRIDNGGRVGFSRTLPNEKKYNLDSPGVRMRFRTDARRLAVDLLYRERTNRSGFRTDSAFTGSTASPESAGLSSVPNGTAARMSLLRSNSRRTGNGMITN